MSGAGRGAEGGRAAWPNREGAWAWSPVRVGPRGKRVGWAEKEAGWAGVWQPGPGWFSIYLGFSLFYF